MQNKDAQSDKISIIIPCFNVEKYIDRCMESVLNQTYRNLEIILVDDGSTDSTGTLLESYMEKDNRVFALKRENKGAGAARNAGLDIATGKYIGFVDSDDWIEPDTYEYLMRIIEKEKADIAACDFFTVNEKHNRKEREKKENLKIMDGNELMLFFLRINGEKSFHAVWNMLYKREVIGDCRFPEGKITEDMLFNYQVYCNCKKYVLSNQKKYFYFYNPNGVTRKELGEKDFALLTNWDVIVKDIKSKKKELSQYALMNRWRADFTLISKAFLYGYDENEISEKQLIELGVQVKKHWKCLMRSRMLDWKRKILLVLICYRYILQICVDIKK